MNKILTISWATLFTLIGVTNTIAAPARGGDRILIANTNAWGSNFTHTEDAKNPSTFGKSGQAGDFVILAALANEGNSTKENDKIVALVARTISDKGGEFMPMVLKCTQGNSGRFGGWTQYMSSATTGTWLCADGKAGEDCLQDANAYDVNDWDMLKPSVRKQLSTSDTTVITNTVTGLDEWHWWSAGDKREGNIILAVVGYTTTNKGVFAAPVSVRCMGNRGGSIWNSFDGKFGEFKIVGNRKLLCSAGYKPNSAKNDCEKIVDPVLEEAKKPKISIEAPDGSLKTYDKESDMNLIKLQQARAGYDTNVHSVYKYGTNKFGVFCKDKSTGLTSQDPLKCSDCTSGLKRGVCLQDNNEQFGACSQCGTGTVYDVATCKCVTAVPLSVTELQFGKGNKATTNIEQACWAKDNESDYKNCIEK